MNVGRTSQHATRSQCSDFRHNPEPPVFRLIPSLKPKGCTFILLRGPVILDSKNGATDGYLELHLPVSFALFSTQLVCLKFFLGAELVDVIALGAKDDLDSFALHRRESGLVVWNRSLWFRTALEAELWRVAITDVLSASASRYAELADPSLLSLPPRGFRTQYAAVCNELVATGTFSLYSLFHACYLIPPS